MSASFKFEKWKVAADRKAKRKIEAMLAKASYDANGHPPSFPNVRVAIYCRNKTACPHMEMRRTKRWRQSSPLIYYLLCRVDGTHPCPKKTFYPVRLDLRSDQRNDKTE